MKLVRFMRHRTFMNDKSSRRVIVRDIIRINQPMIGKEEIDAATEVLKSGILTEKSGMGPRTLEFEKEFATIRGGKTCCRND